MQNKDLNIIKTQTVLYTEQEKGWSKSRNQAREQKETRNKRLESKKQHLEESSGSVGEREKMKVKREKEWKVEERKEGQVKGGGNDVAVQGKESRSEGRKQGQGRKKKLSGRKRNGNKKRKEENEVKERGEVC